MVGGSEGSSGERGVALTLECFRKWDVLMFCSSGSYDDDTQISSDADLVMQRKYHDGIPIK